jgi:hypothetical protein
MLDDRDTATIVGHSNRRAFYIGLDVNRDVLSEFAFGANEFIDRVVDNFVDDL